ncbi:MAG: hypothetical protein IJ351_06345 [Oscillospiraceae bacterium]|nr:hypothetical protein [Oscillospiraceae bacterium]
MRRFHWIKEGLVQAAVILSAAAVYTLFLFMTGDSTKSLHDYFEMATIYLVGMAVIMPAIFNIYTYTQTVPLTLSFGVTRKEVWLGLQLYRIAMLLPVMGANVLLFVLGSRVDILVSLVLTLAGGLYFSGIGGFSGALTVKLGRGTLLMIALVWIVSLALAAVLVVIPVVNKKVDILIYILPLVGTLVYTLCTCFEKKAIKALCVK